jgi:hypothetical protein
MGLESDSQVNPQTETRGHEPSNEERETTHELPPIANPPQPPPAPPANPPPDKEPSKWRENTKLCLEIFGLAVLCAYTVFSCLQWLQIRWTNRLTREALDGSNSALQQTLGRMEWQIKETHEIAKQSLSQATQTGKIAIFGGRSADAANKQAKLLAQEIEMLKNQASARLVIKNLKWEESPDKFAVSFDLANNGGSEATEIGEDLSPQPFAHSPLVDPNLLRPGSTNSGGESLARDELKTITMDVPKDFLAHGTFRWYGYARFTYLDIFGQTKVVCEVLNKKKWVGFYFSPCPSPNTKQQP